MAHALGLLRAHSERADCRSAPKQRDEIASSHCLPKAGTTPIRTRLQQGFAIDEMGFRVKAAQQQF
jgi:hypothetical protein